MTRHSPRGRLRALPVAAALAGVLCATGIASPAYASHGGGPSAGQVAASKATVAEREREVAHAAAALKRAQAKFQRLSDAAEGIVEAYDEAEVKLASAQRAAETAKSVLAVANAQVAKTQRSVAHFARAAYESGGLSTVDAVLSPGGTRALVRRVGALDAISVTQHQTLSRLDAAAIYQAAVAQRAESVVAKAHRAAAAAATAKSAAERAVTEQQSLLASLHRRKAHLAALLADAQANASKLEKERLAALAAPPVVTASAPSDGSSPYADQTGDLSDTISAATGAAAVQEAEAQIGKPYQWGGAGPDTFDCSGLVMWAYAQVGVHLDHWTGFQWEEGAHVAVSDLRPGDLLFFAYDTSDPDTIHHVGMYIGNGQMVEAPYTGADVRISSDSRPDFIGAVRPYQR
ncbi:MAG TPA: NlpC/P60 family protein [Mycobacteriales bacterium]|nr:NlpC/P60 family protein [Mycobacteriales bacterium]